MRNFPRIKAGVSCSVYKVASGDSWLTIAQKKVVNLVELIRANPSITGQPAAGTSVFLPPCNDGGELAWKLRVDSSCCRRGVA
jgi:hypothetical protein